jgi:tetratricopeptide (TPR) repeat protein
MTQAARMPRAEVRPERAVELVLAHAHLRLGSLALARTELETLAGLRRLDTIGLVDLAEVRWRTGDLAGAGEAARAALRADDEDPIALLIAAEAAASLGRPSEARGLATRSMVSAASSIDVIFAGMPRSAAWPPDADEPPPTAPTLFDREPEPAARAEGNEPATEPPPAEEPAGTAPPVARGFWDEETTDEPGAPVLPDPALELEAGRAALVAGEYEKAALKFGLALRLAPALAPAVLEATAGARVANLIMVRGDAHRLAGHEMEAREAYAIAARGGLPERRRKPRGVALQPAAATVDAPEPPQDAAEVEDVDAAALDGARALDGADPPDGAFEHAGVGEASHPPGGTSDEPTA